MKLRASSIWKLAVFRRYYILSALCYFGSGLTSVALPVYVYALTESAAVTSLAAASAGAPYLLFGLFAGALADRSDRKTVMTACSAISGAALLTIPAAATGFGETTAAHLIAANFVVSTAFVWFDAANHGALLSIVGRDRLVAANSVLGSTDTLLRIGSPAVAGLLMYRLGPEWAIAIDGLCYIGAALLLLRISLPSRTRAAARWATQCSEIGADIREGVRYVWASTVIRSLTLLGFGNSLVGGAATGLAVVYGVRVLGFEETSPQMSLLFTCNSLGALLSSAAYPYMRRRVYGGAITIASFLFGSVALTGLALGEGRSAAFFGYAIWSGFHTLTVLNGITLRQQETPDELQGRVHATGRMIAWGGFPLGSFAGGIAAESFGVSGVYVALSALSACLFAIAVATPLRRYGRPVRARDAMRSTIDR